jgi:regulator of RNase E activity RraA
MEGAEPGSVMVIVVEDGLDIAGWGGLLTAGAVAKELAGTVLDSGVRDVVEVEEAEYPVFARSVVPSTTVGRYSTTGTQVPVICGEVLVNPGDIIVGDRDGVVVVPREKAAEVLRVAQEIEATERQMTQEIERLGSILKAYEHFSRI